MSCVIFGFQMLGSLPARTDRHRLAGTVTVDGVPARRLVVVLDRVSFAVLASAISDPVTGAWAVHGIPQYVERGLLVLTKDNTGNYNAEVADYVSQVS